MKNNLPQLIKMSNDDGTEKKQKKIFRCAHLYTYFY